MGKPISTRHRYGAAAPLVATLLWLPLVMLSVGLLPVDRLPGDLLPVAGAAEPPARPQPIRELFVPFDDLSALLETGPRRVFLSRAEFADLQARAKRDTDAPPPQPAALLSANYGATLEEGRARIAGTLTIEVLDEGLHAVPLDLAGVGVRQASLDGGPAPLGRGPDGRLSLFVEGKGPHTLTLEAVAPLATTAARQTLSFTLPAPPTATMRLTVPGNVEVKTGGAVVARKIDAERGVTELELAGPRGATSLAMTLNNRLLQKQRVVVARSVIVDELSSAEERLHVTASMDVVHGLAESFRFALPENFDVVQVRAPQVARWEVAEGVLDVLLREPTAETVVLGITAVAGENRDAAWELPRLVPLDVAGHAAVVGLLVESGLRPRRIDAAGLIPIDTDVFTRRLPESVLAAEPGAPAIRPVAAFYAPQPEFQLAAAFFRPPPELRVTTNLLLVLNEAEQRVQGGLALLPLGERLFAFDLQVPWGWEISEVRDADDCLLAVERYLPDVAALPAEGRPPEPPPEPESAPAGRAHVRLARGVEAGERVEIRFQATATPQGWLDAWETRDVAFPQFAVRDASSSGGAVAVTAGDDLLVRPGDARGLVPLPQEQKDAHGLEGVETNLAYRFEPAGFDLGIGVARTAPQITARTWSLLRVEPDHLVAHYELAYEIRQARTDRLALLLPASTPTEVTIRGLDGVEVKQPVPSDDGEWRRWTVQLGERRRGTVRLAVDLEQNLAEAELRQLSLPLVRAADVEYQSGMVAVEGDAELQIDIAESPRRIDVGELVDARQQPGPRLLGAFAYAGETAEVVLAARRHEAHPLPAAIVERAELVSLAARTGELQSAARFHLRTKAHLLAVELPPESELWSVRLDGTPVAPQRQAQRLLVSLPASRDVTLRDLQVVYATPGRALGMWGGLAAPAPQLSLPAADGSSAEPLPVADLTWHLHLPAGYHLVRSRGSVFTDSLSTPPLAVASLGTMFGRFAPTSRMLASVDMAGGVSDEAYDLPGDDYGTAATQGYELDMEPHDAPQTTQRQSDRRERGERRSASEAGADDAKEAATDAAEPLAPAESAPDAAEPRAPAEPAPDVTAQPVQPGAAASGPDPGGQPSSGERIPAPGTPPLPELGVEHRNGAGQGSTGQAAQVVADYWALEGVRSLQIDLVPADPAVTFHSLGSDPQLDVTLADARRLGALGWGAALLVLLVGLALTFRPALSKVKWIALVCIAATLLPLLLGIGHELGAAPGQVFLAGALLVPYYLLVAAARWLARLPERFAGATLAGLLVAVTLAAAPAELTAAPPATAPADGRLPVVVRVEPPLPPVKVPADALIVPYNPADPEGIAAARLPGHKLLVPYEKYLELHRRAFPGTRPPLPPAHYALSGAEFAATLSGDDYLVVTGHVDVDLLVDDVVGVPLPLAGGVLARAEVAGSPARVEIVAPRPPTAAAQQAAAVQQNQPAAPQQAARRSAPQQSKSQQAANAAPNAPPAEPILMAYLSGKGRQRLELAIRYPVTRRGGWRSVEGRLPGAAATALNLTVPGARTEVRLSGMPDRPEWETTEDNEKIATATAVDGRLDVEWRPRIAEAEVARSLTVTSEATFDVVEDGLRLHWRLDLAFARGQREAFTIGLPDNYLVERVEGENVRGWELKEAPRRLEVTLLAPARGGERLALTLARRIDVGREANGQIDVPHVTLPDAALHRGRVTLRRSPLLDLAALETEGLVRTDLDAKARHTTDSPLGIRPFQAYRFARVPFQARLAVTPVEAVLRARLQSVLRIAARERSLESRINLHAEKRPVYRLRLAVPADLELDEVTAPGVFDWSVAEGPEGRVLSLYLAGGQQGDFALLVRGRLGGPGEVAEVALPRLELLDVADQEGEIVIQSDPALDVRATALQGCAPGPLRAARSWLTPQQRPLARLALHHRNGRYSGTIRVAPRAPLVSGLAVTNVRFTDRSVEETILIDLAIKQAGIRQLAFRLPAWMQTARIRVPLLAESTITPLPGGEQVRVQLTLQDDVMGELRVLVEHDHLLADAPYRAPLPEVENVPLERRYVTLETAGRDEVVADEATGLVRLGRQQKEWKMLDKLLGGKPRQAWLVAGDAPQLLLATRPRAAVETAGARIGLARAMLVVDAGGAYRGLQRYQVDNRTEQYLELQLPAGSRLWTAWVAGEPVKPAQVPGQSAGRVRVPLVKTAAGEGDFEIRVQYGGRLPALGRYRSVDFPLVRTVNVHVEESQVRLWLPQEYDWLTFDGSMRRVDDEGELVAGELAYVNKRLNYLSETLRTAGEFAKVRAEAEIRKLSEESTYYQKESQQWSANARWNDEANLNESVISEIERQIERQQSDEEDLADEVDNRKRLDYLYRNQSARQSKNVVDQIGGNFDAQSIEGREDDENEGQKFGDEWFSLNKLEGKKPPQQGKSRIDLGKKGGQKGQPAKPKGPRVTLGEDEQSLAQQSDGDEQMQEELSDGQLRLRRYAEQLAQKDSETSGRRLRDDGRQQAQSLNALNAPAGQTRGHAAPAGGEQPTSRPFGNGADNGTVQGVDGGGRFSDVAGGFHYDPQTGFAGRNGQVSGGMGGGGGSVTYDASASTTDRGLASLDVTFPLRGREYLFTTPRGDVEITARALDGQLRTRLLRLVGLLAILGIGLLVARRFRAE